MCKTVMSSTKVDTFLIAIIAPIVLCVSITLWFECPTYFDLEMAEGNFISPTVGVLNISDSQNAFPEGASVLCRFSFGVLANSGDITLIEVWLTVSPFVPDFQEFVCIEFLAHNSAKFAVRLYCSPHLFWAVVKGTRCLGSVELVFEKRW